MSRRRPLIDVSSRYLHLDPLVPLAGPLDWSALFGNDHPVELEIGSGKGLFLEGAALEAPGRNFAGIEISRKYTQLAAERLVKHDLANALLIHGEARTILAHGVRERSLAAVHVYYPDPWWKTRHRKRRIFDDWFLDQVERILVPEGELRFATDVGDYFAVMERLMQARGRFEPLSWPEPRAGEEAKPLTHFERKYRAQGREIHRARYRLRAQARDEPETCS
jgi:tRNA (guanine-N7-)-methyltransferase